MKTQLLGDFSVSHKPFANLDKAFAQFAEAPFKQLQNRNKFKKINKLLLKLIQESAENSFLLPAVLDFIARINNEAILTETYRFTSFELWLNHFSKLSLEDNLKIRGKICGRYIPRDEYQTFFPIGMNKSFPGSHFVAAHASPDVDTMIASFWGWADAFAAKVSDGVHMWSLPGRFQDAHVRNLFQKQFGSSIFDQLARHTPTLTLTALDLLTTKQVIKVHANTPASHIDHNHAHKAIILIDDNGYYLGDWRSSDAESVHQVVILFQALLRWFENTIHAKLISAFATKILHISDVPNFLQPIFETEILHSAPVTEYTERQKRHLNDYLKKVLHVHKGIHATFKELGEALDNISESEFKTFRASIDLLADPALYDKEGKLIEDRSKIFSLLEKLILRLDETTSVVRQYIDRLSVMIEVKEKVLSHPPFFVTLRSDIDEIRSRMDNMDHITVVVPESENRWFPVGVVLASHLKQSTLGTVSLRDFSNEDETQMASYLEVISVIDHHKTSLQTSSAPLCIIADAQSSNTLIAERNCQLNSRYGLLGIDEASIDKELQEIGKTGNDPSKLRQLSRLLQLKLNLHTERNYYVNPDREFAEYLCYLYAILDDTDLLSKVSMLDVDAVARILNRMKSISVGYDSEIINLESIPKDQNYAKVSAKMILQNEDMYSIYKKIYAFKEQEVEANLEACIKDAPSSIFADTKEQNGCCRVGQTKLFCTNFSFFSKHSANLRSLWFTEAKKMYESKSQINFHLHMISTIPGADEVYKGSELHWNHRDEMWFWVPSTEQAMERLIYFLNAFHSTEAVQNNHIQVQFLGDNWHELDQAFAQNFPKAERVHAHKPHGLPIAVLYFNPGSINSRKAAISPYLPRFVP